MKKKLLFATLAGAAGLGLVGFHANVGASELTLTAGGMPTAPVSPVAVSSDTALPSPLVFNFTKGDDLVALEGTDPTTAAAVIAGFEEAGSLWSALLEDPITVEVTINYRTLAADVLGTTGNATIGVAYSSVRTALAADAKSSLDTSVVANLQPGTSLDFLTNDTTVVEAPRIRDNDGSANNHTLDIPRANAKALGIAIPIEIGGEAVSDGNITFNDTFDWDFDRSDGIGSTSHDFVAVAAHEIGHLLGFVSGVDVVDAHGGMALINLDDFRVFSVLDLLRYSADSLDESSPPTTGSVLDLAFAGSPFFSTDAGATQGPQFETGANNGDGFEASHWKDDLGTGLMDPTLNEGELGMISEADLRAMDAIGWDRTIPEPATAGILVILGASALTRRSSRTSS